MFFCSVLLGSICMFIGSAHFLQAINYSYLKIIINLFLTESWIGLKYSLTKKILN